MATVELLQHEAELQKPEVQYQLTLKQICSQWFDKLTGKESSEELDITDSAKCVVAEAYGFDEKRIFNPEYVYGCEECAKYAADFVGLLCYPLDRTRSNTVFNRMYDNNGYVTEEILNNHSLVRSFLNHWSTTHL